MRVLLITTSNNSMSQRTYVELIDRGYEVSIHITSTKEEMIKVVYEEKPDLIIAPFLKIAIPKEIWENYICIIVHPGIKGDRGPSSIDWAILNNSKEWGVTLLQADLEMDAGDIWASNNYRMREVSKSTIYRHEATRAAMKGLIDILDKFQLHKYGKFKI